MKLTGRTKAQAEKYLVPALASALMLALALHCENLPASKLRWILAPVASFVEVITGMYFTMQADGYTDSTGTIVLGNTCTGLNFMTITVLMSSFSFLPAMHFRRQVIVAPLLFAGAYLLTVIANSSRISAAVKLVQRSDAYPALGTDTVHEAQGVLYYLLFLLIYYFTLRYIFTKTGHYAPVA